MKRVSLFLFGSICLISSCISSYQPDIPTSDSHILVVEGQITDEVGPFRIKLSNTFDVDAMQQYGEPVSTANVQIFDDQGNLYQLNYIAEGWYETEDTLLQGVPGNTYTLNITTDDGAQYESSPVRMLDLPPIDSLYFKEVTKTRFEEGEAIDENWLDIFVDAHDPSGQTNYWKWDYVETWEIELLKDSVPFAYSPYEPIVKVNIELGKNVEERCWLSVPSKTILTTSTKDKAIKEINQFLLKSIPPNNDRLHIQYSILVKQTALSPELYKYWKKLEESNEQTGGIYEKIPEQIFGNIDCCTGNGKTLGYFSASAVRTKRIFISPSSHDIKTASAYEGCIYLVPNLKVFPKWFYGVVTACAEMPANVGKEAWTYDAFCRDCRKYGSNVKPNFWEE